MKSIRQGSTDWAAQCDCSGFGRSAAWLDQLHCHRPWNNLFLVIIVLWLQTGFAMVLFSAAIKGIPEETLEAARVDGASEIQIFFKS